MPDDVGVLPRMQGFAVIVRTVETQTVGVSLAYAGCDCHRSHSPMTALQSLKEQAGDIRGVGWWGFTAVSTVRLIVYCF